MRTERRSGYSRVLWARVDFCRRRAPTTSFSYIRVSYYRCVVPFDAIYYCHYRYLYYTRCVLYARYVVAPTRKGCSAPGRVTVVCIRMLHIQLWISKIFFTLCHYSFSVLDLFFGFDNNVPTRRKEAFKMWRTARDLRFFLPRAACIFYTYFLWYILYDAKVISPENAVSEDKSLDLVVLASCRI